MCFTLALQVSLQKSCCAITNPAYTARRHCLQCGECYPAVIDCPVRIAPRRWPGRRDTAYLLRSRPKMADPHCNNAPQVTTKRKRRLSWGNLPITWVKTSHCNNHPAYLRPQWLTSLPHHSLPAWINSLPRMCSLTLWKRWVTPWHQYMWLQRPPTQDREPTPKEILAAVHTYGSSYTLIYGS